MALTTSICKWGNGQGIRIPKNILDVLGWNESEKVEIIVEDNSVKIKKVSAKERKNIKELFKNYDGVYRKETIDWGEPVGKEIW